MFHARINDIEYEEDNTYCCDQEGCLMGFGQLIRKSELRLHMARVIIAPDDRYKGNGNHLVGALIDLARKKGCRIITLNVYRRNTPALKLYSALGFREVAEKSTDELCRMIMDNST